MRGMHALSLKGADLALCRALDYYKEGLAVVIADTACVGGSLFCAVVALCTHSGQQSLCRKYTLERGKPGRYGETGFLDGLVWVIRRG